MPREIRSGAEQIARAAWVYAGSAILLGVGFHLAHCTYMSQTYGPTYAGTDNGPSSVADSFFEIGRFSSVLLDAVGSALAIWFAKRIRAVAL